MTGVVSFLLEHRVPEALTLGLIILIGVLLRVLMDEDRADRFRGRVYQGLFKVTRRRDHEKKFITNDIKGRLNLARRGLHHGRGGLASAIDVQWVEGADPAVFDVREGEFIVRLDSATDQRRNIIYLTEAVALRTVALPIRHVLSPAIRRALDVTMVKKLLLQINHKPTVEAFYSDVYQPLLSGRSPEFQKWNSKVLAIDENGLYETLLLVELEDFGKSISGLEPRPYMVGEVEGLIEFLYKLATRRPGQDTRLDYLRGTIRVGTLLVGQLAKISESIDPYLNMVKGKIREDEIDALYVMVWGRAYLRKANLARWTRLNRNVSKLIEEIRALDEVSRDFLSEYRYVDFQGRRGRGMIARFDVTHGG